MDEHELDSLLPGRPFGTADATRPDAEARRLTTLGGAIWGRTSTDLQRQLLARHPEIPAEVTLADLKALQRVGEGISRALNDRRSAWLGSSPSLREYFSAVITVGSQSFTAWEARCEILRGAIEYLENR